MPSIAFRGVLPVAAWLLGAPSLLLQGCGEDSPAGEQSGGTAAAGGSAQGGHGGSSAGHSSGGEDTLFGGAAGEAGAPGPGGESSLGGAVGQEGGAFGHGGESVAQGGSEPAGWGGGGGLSAGAENGAGAESSGGAGATNPGEGGAGEGGTSDTHDHVQWLGKCTPVALSDDAQTVLALEGVWTEASGWTALPDLPGGDVSNTPRTLSGNGRVVYGNSGSALGNEIYRYDVESGTIQGLGELYYSDLGAEPSEVPDSVRSIDTNEDGSVLVGYASTPPMDHFRWTPNGGFVDITPNGPWGGGEPGSAVLSANAATAIFGTDLSPAIVSTTEPALASDQFGGVVLFPVSVSGDGKWYSLAGTHFGPAKAASNCLLSWDGCQGANQPILDLDYDGHAGVGREYYGISGGRQPVGSFYWSSSDNVRYLHEALYDNGVFVDVDILSRVAINADGRSVLGTATRRFSDGSSHDECFIASFSDPIDSAPVSQVVDLEGGPAPLHALSAGGATTCARGSDGSVRCWGAGIATLLGRAESDGWSARAVVPLADAVQLSLAPDHGCELLSDHSVRCWGENGGGQLGDGTLLSSDVPVGVVDLDDAIEVAVAGGASCALREGGSVQCWGSNRTTPTRVPGLPTARAVSLAGSGGCAILDDGRVSCWGDANVFATDSSDGPWPLSQLQNVSQFAMAGSASWCALSSDGVVRCSYPQCCDESGCPPDDPVASLGTVRTFSKPVSQIAVGDLHFCALLEDGTVECSGYGRSGELGAKDRVFCKDTPIPVPGVTGAVQIAAGSHHTCALLASGAVRCWGLDDVGQLGFGFAYTNRLPVPDPPVWQPLYISGLSPGLSRPAYVRRAGD